MNKYMMLLVLGISLLLGACLGAGPSQDPGQKEDLSALVYKDPT